jgi:hypothetical protein
MKGIIALPMKEKYNGHEVLAQMVIHFASCTHIFYYDKLIVRPAQ